MENLLKKLNEKNDSFYQQVELLKNNPELLQKEYDKFIRDTEDILEQIRKKEEEFTVEE